MKKSFRKVLRTVWAIAGISFMIYLWWGLQAHNVEPEVYENSSSVQVEETGDLISFRNTSASTDSIRILFYPGGMADPKAYAPLARDIAEYGYTIHIVKMPWRMANYGYTKIDDLFELDDPSVKYILAGHSQGAKMAAQYVYENPDNIKGLILMGTSHPRDINMSHLDLPALKIYAQYDGLASPEEVMDNKNKLPANTSLVMIQGGNHARFANLGNMFMDGSATISREEQQRQAVEHIIDFLGGI